MERAEALRELHRMQKILPELIDCITVIGVKPKIPEKRFETSRYFLSLYGICPTTYQARRDGIREQIKKGRYPENAIQDRLVDKAVFYDYNKHRYKLLHCPNRVSDYDDKRSMVEALKLEGSRT